MACLEQVCQQARIAGDARLQRRGQHAAQLEIGADAASGVQIRLATRVVGDELIGAGDEQGGQLEVGVDLASGLRQHARPRRGVEARRLHQLAEVDALRPAAFDERDLGEHSGRATCLEDARDARRGANPGLADDARQRIRRASVGLRARTAAPTSRSRIDARSCPDASARNSTVCRAEPAAVRDLQIPVRRQPLDVRVIVGELDRAVVSAPPPSRERSTS